jgi:hypothetical protein
VPYASPARPVTKTIYIPVAYQGAWEQLAALAQQSGRSLSLLVSEAVAHYLDEREQGRE